VTADAHLNRSEVSMNWLKHLIARLRGSTATKHPAADTVTKDANSG
jgi:hypothetical protein